MSDFVPARPEVARPEVAPPQLIVRKIAVLDVVEAVVEGLRDFQAAPFYGLFFGGIYAAGGILILIAATRGGIGYLVYPLAAGFALIGPFVATGLYEVSRRRECGEPLSAGAIFACIRRQGGRELGWMAFVTIFVFIVWMYQVRLLVALFLGLRSFTSVQEFVMVVLTTPEGWVFLAVGHVVGAILAVILYALTVVSFPLLLDRDVDFVTAMITSVRTVTLNPVPMLGFAAAVIVLTIAAMLPVFLGLVVVLPVLGHATWRLYRRAIAWKETAVPSPGGAAGDQVSEPTTPSIR
jgi:uncharacterized membrane protein